MVYLAVFSGRSGGRSVKERGEWVGVSMGSGQLARVVITEKTHINTGGRFLPRLLIICRVHLNAVCYLN